MRGFERTGIAIEETIRANEILVAETSGDGCGGRCTGRGRRRDWDKAIVDRMRLVAQAIVENEIRKAALPVTHRDGVVAAGINLIARVFVVVVEKPRGFDVALELLGSARCEIEHAAERVSAERRRERAVYQLRALDFLGRDEGHAWRTGEIAVEKIAE